MLGPGVYLIDRFPRAGFLWRRGQGSPRILRSDARDAAVQRVLVDLLGRDGVHLWKREVQHLVHGIRPDEGIIDFFERSAEFSELARALPVDVWVELVYQIAHARDEYQRTTPRAQQEGDADQLTALAFKIDDLVAAAGRHWDWMALELFAYPHLIGEAVDYEVDDSDDSDDEGWAAAAGGADDKMETDEDAGTRELPRRMEKLAITDADGDVEMEM